MSCVTQPNRDAGMIVGQSDSLACRHIVVTKSIVFACRDTCPAIGFEAEGCNLLLSPSDGDIVSLDRIRKDTGWQEVSLILRDVSLENALRVDYKRNLN